MKRSRLSIVFILASIAITIMSFFVPSLFNPSIKYIYDINSIHLALVYISISLIACLYAYIERSTASKALSTRSLCGFNVFISFLFLLFLSNTVFEVEEGSIPINQNGLFIYLWIISFIPLIIAALIYEDQILKRII